MKCDMTVVLLTHQLEVANLQKKYLDDKVALLKEMQELKKQIKEQDPSGFDAFCKARVRVRDASPSDDTNIKDKEVLKGVIVFFDQESVDEYDQEVLKSKV